METKEKTYNGMVINGFSAILFNLVMLPALAFLNFYLLFGWLFRYCLCLFWHLY